MARVLHRTELAAKQEFRQRHLWGDAFRRFRRNRLAMLSLSFIVFVLLTSILGPMISPYDYRRQDLLNVASPPNSAHWFGTDSLGRDYLTRIMMGGRTCAGRLLHPSSDPGPRPARLLENQAG